MSPKEQYDGVITTPLGANDVGHVDGHRPNTVLNEY